MNKLFNYYTKDDFLHMRKAGKVAALALDMLVNETKEGVTTKHLDRLTFEFLGDHKALPATLGYRGYRHCSCISLNHVICHGIPSERKLKNGDILNIDITTIINGFHGDTSRMYYVGNPKVKAKKLIQTTFDAMWAGINLVKPGATLFEIGSAIQKIAENNNYAIVYEFCGHGVGKNFHEPPNILHYGEIKDNFGQTHKAENVTLQEGMCFTIEPMLNEGKAQSKMLADGWTAVTKDKLLSAQFEHSIGVSKDGFEVFTLSPNKLFCPPYDTK